MLMTGKEYLSSIRDGRRVYIGGELVEDVTAHPAFRNAAQSFAMIYDRKRDPENRDLMTFEEDGETFSTYFLLPRTREDLQRRFETHRRIASWTHGLLGRSPDNFPSYVSGLVMDPAMFDSIRQGFGNNIRNYYQHMRGNDIFASHTVTNPQGWRPLSPADNPRHTPPTLRVINEDDSGVTINGLKMLGTASVFCHETWCGNLQPVAAGQERESITCVVPLNAPGVSIWSRKPYERYVVSEFDNPLAARFDETDSAVLFENVKVPWECVFCHNNVEMTRAIYHAHTRPCDGQPPGKCALPGEAQPDRRHRKQARGDEQRPSHPGGAVHSRSACCDAGDPRGIDNGPDQLRRGTSGRLSHRQSSLRLCGAALVHQSLLGNLRLGARAHGRRRVSDAR
jgi:4-hydroxyphenylacetate 3-monooxygenase